MERYHDIGGFDVPVDNALGVSVLHGLADLEEQSQSLFCAQVVLIAVFGDGNAGNQLHDKIRPAGVSGSGVEDFGDIGVVHEGQGLSLRLEAGDDLAGVHAQFDDLEGDLAADGLLLLGHVDHRHAALADLLQELVPTNDRARALRRGSHVGSGGQGLAGRLQEPPGLIVRLEQSLDSGTQRGIWSASPIQVSRSFRSGGLVQGLQEERSHLRSIFFVCCWLHDNLSPPSNAPCELRV